MKRVLIYSPDSLDPEGLRWIQALAHRLLLADDAVDVCVLGDMPANQGTDAAHLRRVHLPSLRSLIVHQTTQGQRERVPLSAALAQRSELIAQTLNQFGPDLLIVERLPLGRYDELGPILTNYGPRRPPKRVLLLRDLPGRSEPDSTQWATHGYFDVIAEHYDRVLVLGDQRVVDLGDEYAIPAAAASKIDYCGYLDERPPRSNPEFVRRALGVRPEQPLVLVRAGPGRDEEDLIRNLVVSLAQQEHRVRIHILCGQGMRESACLALTCIAHALPSVSVQHSSRDVLSLIAAADVVVTDAGYRSTCEILTLHKRAVLVPSTNPLPGEVQRAARLAARGLASVVSPARGPDAIVAAVVDELLSDPSDEPQNLRANDDAVGFATSTMLGLIDFDLDANHIDNAEAESGQVTRRARPGFAAPHASGVMATH